MIADHDLVFGRCRNKEPHSSGILLCRVVVVGYEKCIFEVRPNVKIPQKKKEKKKKHGKVCQARVVSCCPAILLFGFLYFFHIIQQKKKREEKGPKAIFEKE